MGAQQKVVQSLDALRPDPQNPRTISDAAAAGLGASIGRFGDLSGIVFNVETGHLVAGHQRISQLRTAGVEQWKVARTPGATRTAPDGTGSEGDGWIDHGGRRFRVRLVRWSPETQRAANLTANNPAIEGDFTALAAMQLRDLDLSDGLGALRLDALLQELAPIELQGLDEPTSVRGAVWGRGESAPKGMVTVLLGDLECRIREETLLAWVARLDAARAGTDRSRTAEAGAALERALAP